MGSEISNQIAYRFTSYINELGKIDIPKTMQAFFNKKVEIILLLPDEKKETSDSYMKFHKLIDEYCLINEPELDYKKITDDRKQTDTRGFVFD